MIRSAFKAIQILWLPVAMLVLYSIPHDSAAYKAIADFTQSQLRLSMPESFGLVPKVLCLMIWIFAGQYLFHLFERKSPSFSQIIDRLNQEAALKYRRINNLLSQELARGQKPGDYRQDALTAIQTSLTESFKDPSIEVSYMQPQLARDGKRYLFITLFANAVGRIPVIYQQRKGFLEGAGFPWKAWKTRQFQAGNRLMFGLLRDPRFVTSPGDDGRAKAFMAVPVFSQNLNDADVDSEDIDPQGILCISSDKHDLFPSNREKLRRIGLAIEPLLEQLAHFVELHDDLEPPGMTGSSTEIR